ncbi:hypothetical protein GF362_05180 [Candidatus Dojkabacteria bacterium]|nr:hypothetical protein [Candidatus Dojkabacteria bacterium]
MENKGFNLLPKEVFEQRQKTKTAVENTSMFAAVLPFVAVLGWIIFMFLNYSVERSIKNIRNEISQVEREMLEYQSDKDKKALLILKTRVLKDIVIRDVNPEKFFNIVQRVIKDSNLDIHITTYGREKTGKFFIKAIADSPSSVASINRIFRNNEEILDVELSYLQNEENSGAIEFQITFNLLD